MPTCVNGHDMAEAAAFCHECGAPRDERTPEPAHPHVYLYVSVAAVVVIVLGLLGIGWALSDDDTPRVGSAQDAGLSMCGRAPTQRPVTITVVCGSGTVSLTDVTWSQWSGQAATGTGTYVSGAKTTSASVVLSGVIATASGPQFTRMAVTPAGGRPQLETIVAYGSSGSAGRSTPPRDGRPCPGTNVGIIGTHASCEFAGRVRKAYLAAGGHGQGLTVSASSAVTHRTYRNIACAAGVYVVCVGGTDDTAKVYFGPFH